jgi:hypothetical protein
MLACFELVLVVFVKRIHAHFQNAADCVLCLPAKNHVGDGLRRGWIGMLSPILLGDYGQAGGVVNYITQRGGVSYIALSYIGLSGLCSGLIATRTLTLAHALKPLKRPYIALYRHARILGQLGAILYWLTVAVQFFRN